MPFVAGQKLRASQLNDAIYAPYFHGTNTSAQSVPKDAWTSINLQTVVFDSHNGRNANNPSRYVAQVRGIYQVSGSVGFASGSGLRGARLAKNGTAIQSGGGFVGGSGALSGHVTPTVLVQLDVGDYVEVQGYQASGGALNTAGNSDTGCGLTVRMLPKETTT